MWLNAVINHPLEDEKKRKFKINNKKIILFQEYIFIYSFKNKKKTHIKLFWEFKNKNNDY